MITRKSSLTDVAFAVGTALNDAGFTAVLTGGSAATYYSANAYLSADLDFVLIRVGMQGERVLERLGYRRKGDFYRHSQSLFTLDFPPGPLAVGDEIITNWSTVKRRTQVLHVLTPTDSCRDRLASFLFWNDFNGLEQALVVCREQRSHINLARIRAWCKAERQEQKFRLFAERLKTLGE